MSLRCRRFLSFTTLVSALTGCGTELSDGPEVIGQELIGATITNARPEIGWLKNGTEDLCTATLVDPRFVLTAGHCIDFRTGPSSGRTFHVTNHIAVDGVTFPVDRTYTMIAGTATTSDAANDVGFMRLTTPVPSSVAVPAAMLSQLPPSGTAATRFGFGCNDRNTLAGVGPKEFISFTWGVATKSACNGDSGGPSIVGGVNDNGAIFAVTVGSSPITGLDWVGDVPLHGVPGLEAMRQFGAFTETNNNFSQFASAAQAFGAKLFSGRFNRDSFGDLVLVGGSGWQTIAVGLGNGNGTFSWVNGQQVQFAAWAGLSTAQPVVGDFNRDGVDDIALTGVSGWGSIPVVFSTGNGLFTAPTNFPVASFPNWASQSGARALAGDFNGDGAADIALTGVSGWDFIALAISQFDGHFTPLSKNVASFPAWAASSLPLSGDFDGDGDADIALVAGPGWNTIPVASSNRDGTFNVTNNTVRLFPAWATNGGPKFAVGDFDADGDADIVVAGGSGWETMAFALSTRNGTFIPANLPLMQSAPWLRTTGVRITAVNIDGQQGADIALAGGSGWATVPTVQLLR
jgi:hypothetical protein